jgi:integrase
VPPGRPRKSANRQLPVGVYARTRNGRTRYYDKHGHSLGPDVRKAALLVAQRALTEDYTEATWAGASKRYREYVERKHKNGEIGEHTIKAYRKHLDRLDEGFGAVRLDAIRTVDIRKMVTAAEETRAWALALLGAFRRVWQRAIQTGLIERADPSHGISVEKPKARTVVVTDAMLLAVAEQGDQVVRDWARLTVVCGQRVSDVLVLTRAHIVGDELRPPNSKTHEPIRIALTGDLKVVVDELLTRPRRVTGPWLVQNERGGKVTYSALSQRWDKAYRKARELDPRLPAFQRRDLRAKSATDEQATAQARLGHKSRAMTERHYIREVDWNNVPLAMPGRLPRGK